jgi:putative molybdopterin biosynthesis protein
MSVYVHDIPLEEAIKIVFDTLENIGLAGVLDVEPSKLDVSLCGRVLAKSVWAKRSSPHYHASAMDGFAVRAWETSGATLTNAKILDYGDQSKYVDTGDILPDGFNAVIPIENVESISVDNEIAKDIRNPDKIRIRASVAPWQHVRVLGEDMVATQLVIPAGQILRPIDLGTIAASGATEINVSRKPNVAIIPTGTELVNIGDDVKPGDIIEFNSLIIGGLVESYGANSERFDIVEDDFNRIKETLLQAAESNDLVLINAGSSAGSEDFTSRIIEEIGTLLFHGVAVRPGHPVVMGVINLPNRQVPVIGIPGYPVSAAITGEIFVKPIIEMWLGVPEYLPETIEASLTNKIASPAGDDDYMRVMLGKIDEKWLAFPLSKGAGVISSLVKADGLAILPRGVYGKMPGEKVNVQLLRTRNHLEETIFAVGSHDLTLDIVTEMLANQGIRFLSSNVGSVGGLLAIKRNQAHIAGAHLLDVETGEYNLSYIKKYIPDRNVVKIKYLKRSQGLIINSGNPKNITNINDISRDDITFSNRQRGAGTRILLDFELDKLGIQSELVKGFDEEEISHLGVAAAVKSGRADCGLGIAAAAAALNLDFIPLFEEEYDLIIPEEYLESKNIKILFECLNSKEFIKNIKKFPGYSTNNIGTVHKIAR